MRLCPVILPTLLLCSALGAARAQDVVVSGQEIEEKWVGKELYGSAPNGTRVVMKLKAGGAASVSAGSFNDTGTWRPWDKGYCTTWTTMRSGQERCFTVTRSGNRVKVSNPDGSLSGYFTNAP